MLHLEHEPLGKALKENLFAYHDRATKKKEKPKGMRRQIYRGAI